LEAAAFFSDRARWIADCGRKVVGRTRPLNLRLRQRLRTVRIALKMALARRKVGEIIAKMSDNHNRNKIYEAFF
jgi:hypothetical protein